MAILGRLKKIRVNEDEDEEIDDVDEDDEDDEGGDEDDDDELNGGGLVGKLGKLRGLGKIGSAGGMLGKVMKRGGNEDDEDDDGDDDDEDLSSVSVVPVAALDLSENAEAVDSAVEPGPGPEVGLAAVDSVVSLTEAPVESTADSVPAEEAEADDLELGDIFEEKLEIDPILRDLALSQDDTTAGQLLNELTALVSQFEKRVSN